MAADEPPDLAEDLLWEKRWVGRETGSHYSQSNKRPGYESPLTRDDANILTGQVTIGPEVEGDETDYSYASDSWTYDAHAHAAKLEREREEFAQVVGALLALGVIVAEKAAPHVNRWWANRARPAIRSTLSRLSRTHNNDDSAITVPNDAPETGDNRPELAVTLEATAPTMTTAEAQEHLEEALTAWSVIEEKSRLFRTTRIVNAPTMEIERAKSTPEKAEGGRLKLSLLDSQPVLDARTLDIGRLLAQGRGGDHAPSRTDTT